MATWPRNFAAPAVRRSGESLVPARLYLEAEVTEYQLAEKLDDSEFAEP